MLSDLTYALRQFRKHPGFSLGIVFIVALALGANTAEFSLTRAVLFKPLSWPHADRLVYVWNTDAGVGWPVAPVAVPDYLDRRTQTDCFEDSALYAEIIFNCASGPAPEQVTGVRVTPSFFSTLGATPWKGRGFTAEEATPGREKVTVVSYDLWQTELGGRDGAVGEDIRLNGETYRIVGIMPRDFVSPRGGLASLAEPDVRLWVPYAFTAEERSEKGRGDWEAIMIARLRPGVSIEQAQQQVDLVQQNNAKRLNRPLVSRQAGGFGGLVVGYREQNIRSVRPMLLILQTAVALILLIACANVANLLLVRATARKAEIAIRLALGCGRLRLARQLLTESFLPVTLGGALGVLVAHGGLGLLRRFGGDALPFNQMISLDGTMLGFALLLTLGVGLFFGLIPLLLLWRPDSANALREGNARGSAGGSTGVARGALIVVEVALALMLLIAAGLTLKSFAKLQDVRPGFTSDNLLTAQLSLPPALYKDGTSQSAFFAEALERIRSAPGVRSASAISFLPFSGTLSTSDYSVKGEMRGKNDPDRNGQMEVIEPAYFQSMQIPLIHGRGFSDADSAKAESVVIIDQFLARRCFPGRDPIGLQLKTPYNLGRGAPWSTIVGVVGEVKAANLADAIVKETLYFPLAQRPQPTMALVLKTVADPRALVSPLRETIHRIDPELAIFDVHTMDQRLADSLTGYRSPMILLMLFGAAALVLATLGLYAVLSYAVGCRTREIGIRIALGAQGSAILALVVGQGLQFALLGVALGLGGSFAFAQLLRSLLFGVSADDPLIYLAVPALLLAVAAFACLVPARRAARVDPLVALRTE